MAEKPTVTIPLERFEQMHVALIAYKFLLCEAAQADVFMRDHKIEHVKALQAANEPLFFSTPHAARERRLTKGGCKW